MDFNDDQLGEEEVNEIYDELGLMHPMGPRGQINRKWDGDVDDAVVDDEESAADPMLRFRFQMCTRSGGRPCKINRRPIVVRNIDELCRNCQNCPLGGITCRLCHRFGNGRVRRCRTKSCRRDHRKLLGLCMQCNRCPVRGLSCGICNKFLKVKTRDLCRDCHLCPLSNLACQVCQSRVGRCRRPPIPRLWFNNLATFINKNT